MRRGVCLLTLAWMALGSPARALDWGPEERLTTKGTVSETGLNHGALAMDSWGRLTAAWAEQDGPNSNFQINTRTRELGGVWGPDETAVVFNATYIGEGLGAKFPSLVTLPGDTLLMVWHDYRVAGINNLELFTKVRAGGEAWGDSTTETRLTTTAHPETDGDNSYLPNLVVAPDGTAHVAWYDFRYDGDNAEILFKSRTGGAWDTTPGDGPDENVSANPSDSNFPALASGPDGALHAAWRDNANGGFRILYRHRPPGDAWSAPDTLSPPSAAADGVALDVAPDGTLVAVWADPREGTKAVYLRERTPGGVWGPPTRVSPAAVGAEEPDISVDPSGRRHVAWQDGRVSVFNRQVFYQSAAAGAGWDSTGAGDTQISFGVSGKSSRPTLHADGAGRVFVLWQDTRHTKEEIYFRAAQDPSTATSTVTPRVLVHAYPNPFRSRTVLSALDSDTRSLSVFDIHGRLRATLRVSNGESVWDGRDEHGVPVPPGVYLLAARTGTGWHSVGRVVRSR